ncbi:hypothetical protein K0M31_004634 [Melipona bicolor]|uniref:Uncharacterized protein n=1 Tax=Melipona bicolor TaxID=60889 RepID=A0AA40FXZ4_9HYME|nr:hypothetical protein K0M31_004634 [Melipona bicolor]
MTHSNCSCYRTVCVEYIAACHPLDPRKFGTMASVESGGRVGIPNRHLYTRDSGSLWEACRENCVIFHARERSVGRFKNSRVTFGPAAGRGQPKDGPARRARNTVCRGRRMGGCSREDVCLAAPDKIASLLIKLCSWMSLLNSVVNTHIGPAASDLSDITRIVGRPGDTSNSTIRPRERIH